MTYTITDFTNSARYNYGRYLLYDRAFPNLYDGMKPVQRRVLWAMYANNVKKLTKSANIVGYVYPYHPHGSSYGTLVNMTMKNRQHIQPVEGKGNWGDAMSSEIIEAADRYTEAKLSKHSQIYLKEVNNKGVDFEKSYDGKKDIVTVFPVTAPMLLFNYNTGIGMGYATTLLPFNTKDIYNILEAKLNDKDYELVYPDFANGCTIVENKVELDKLYKTGKARFILSSQYEIINDKEIIIKSIPENVTREVVVKEIEDLAKEKVIPEIKRVVDTTGFNGFEISIEVKKDAERVMKILLQKTSLTKSISSNLNVIADDQFYQLGVDEVLNRWIDWRKQVVKRELDVYLDKVNKEMNKLETILSVKRNKDTIIPIIMESKEVEKDLSKWYNEEQIQLILSMKLQQLTKNDEGKIKTKLNELNNLIGKIAGVNINDLILKAYRETVPMLERKSQVIKPLEKVKIKKEKEVLKFDIKNGIIVEGNKELKDNERLVIADEENNLYSLSNNNIKYGLPITNNKIIFEEIVRKDGQREFIVEFKDDHIVKLSESVFYIKKYNNPNFFYSKPSRIGEELEGIIKENVVFKKSRKSKGSKIYKHILEEK